MNSMDLKRAEKLSFNLLIASVALAVLIFLVVSLTGDGWAQIAGFFMGFCVGGFLAVVPALYSGYILIKMNASSANLKSVLALSVVWFMTVCALYVF